jgi:hypothetical protein
MFSGAQHDPGITDGDGAGRIAACVGGYCRRRLEQRLAEIGINPLVRREGLRAPFRACAGARVSTEFGIAKTRGRGLLGECEQGTSEACTHAPSLSAAGRG